MIKAKDAIATARSLLGTPYSKMDCIGLIRAIIRQSPGGVPDYRCEGTNWLWDSINNSGKYKHLIARQESLAGVQAGMLPFKRYGTSDEGHIGIATGEGTVIHSSSVKGCVVETPLTAAEGWDLLGTHRYIGTSEVAMIEPEIEVKIEPEPGIEAWPEDPVTLRPTLYEAKVVTQKDPLRVRDYPNTGRILGHVPKGRTVEVLDDNRADWSFIRYNELEGYACSDYLERIAEEPTEQEAHEFTTLINVVDGTQIVLGGDWREAED